jgi:hypothetical protein
MKNTKILPKIRALAREIEQIKEQQRRQGLFAMTENFSHAHVAALRKTSLVRGF